MHLLLYFLVNSWHLIDAQEAHVLLQCVRQFVCPEARINKGKERDRKIHLRVLFGWLKGKNVIDTYE